MGIGISVKPATRSHERSRANDNRGLEVWRVLPTGKVIVEIVSESRVKAGPEGFDPLWARTPVLSRVEKQILGNLIFSLVKSAVAKTNYCT